VRCRINNNNNNNNLERTPQQDADLETMEETAVDYYIRDYTSVLYTPRAEGAFVKKGQSRYSVPPPPLILSPFFSLPLSLSGL